MQFTLRAFAPSLSMPRVIKTGGPPHFGNERFWRWRYDLTRRVWLRLVACGSFVVRVEGDEGDEDPLYRRRCGSW